MSALSRAAPFALLALGLLQMTGEITGLTLIQGLGAATTASPAPKVFTSARGLETFSTRFYLEWTDDVSVEHTRELTPELYAKIRGPYNRRNVYGAALAYGPVLAADERLRPLFDAVTSFALCGDAPLLRELGLVTRGSVRNVRVRYEPRRGVEAPDLPLTLEAACP